MRTHRAALLRPAHPRPGSLVKRVHRPKAFPAQALIGPQLPGPDWDDVLQDLASVTAAGDLDAESGRTPDRYEDKLILHFDLQGAREEDRYRGGSEGAKVVQTQMGRHRSRRQLTPKPGAADERWGWLADRVQEWQILRSVGQRARESRPGQAHALRAVGPRLQPRHVASVEELGAQAPVPGG